MPTVIALPEMIRELRDRGRKFLSAAIPVLEEQRAAAKVDLYEPTPDEVLGGLFARVFRFLQTVVLDYHLWAEDLGRVVLRMMLEALFCMRFLSQNSQAESFLAFQRYGIGQEKLFKMQLRKLVEEGKLRESPELLGFIDSDSDEEIWDELVNVRLKNFEDLRKLATEAGMKEDYVLYYQPDSTVVHGHWPALRRYYLEQCREPLHRSHLQPTFGLPPLDFAIVVRAFGLFADAYEIWARKYGLEDRMGSLIDGYFNDCEPIISKQASAASVVTAGRENA